MKGIYLAVLGKVLWGLASLVLLAPVFYALLSSFKGKAEFFQSAWWQLPDEFRFGNYATAFAKIHFFELAMNSLTIVVGAVAGILILASLAGFVLAWFEGTFLRVVAAGILVCLMVPLAAGLVSLLLFSARLGLLDSPLALWGPYIAFHLPFSIYLMKTYYEGIPVSLLEAATVDGANFFQLYLRVVLPMGVPMMVALAAINFVKIWGEFALALALLPNPKWWTLSAGIFNRAEMMRHYSMPEMLAAALLAVVPSLVMFALCQKVLFSIKLSGAVKG